MNLVKSTFKKGQVTLLLEDLTGQIEPLNVTEREKQIQSGVNYGTMLPLECTPSREDVLRCVRAQILQRGAMAECINMMACKISLEGRKRVILVSLARAGLTTGVLLAESLKKVYGVEVKHYGISIIRGVGIDINAMDYIVAENGADCVKDIIFVDGWVGKGAIFSQLREAVESLKAHSEVYSELEPRLAVISDPTLQSDYFGTYKDVLIPTSTMNSTTCGLISRTIYNEELIGANDFHGAIYWSKFKRYDKTQWIINETSREIILPYRKKTEADVTKMQEKCDEVKKGIYGVEAVKNIADIHHIADINKIKPGIGETTRVLLRRVPDRILISDSANVWEISGITRLAQKKKVPIEVGSCGNYKAVGIIKELSSDI